MKVFTMKVLMRDLREHPVDLEVDCTPQQIDLSDPDFRFPQNVVGKLHFHLAGDKVVSEGTVSTRVESDCVRCLKKVFIDIKVPVRTVYENNPELLTPEMQFLGPEEDSLAYFDGEAVEPGPQLRESVLLELPQFPVCDQACKGLCPVCGANLNTHPCSCHIEGSKEPSWKSAIRNLKLGGGEEEEKKSE